MVAGRSGQPTAPHATGPCPTRPWPGAIGHRAVTAHRTLVPLPGRGCRGMLATSHVCRRIPPQVRIAERTSPPLRGGARRVVDGAPGVRPAAVPVSAAPPGRAAGRITASPSHGTPQTVVTSPFESATATTSPRHGSGSPPPARRRDDPDRRRDLDVGMTYSWSGRLPPAATSSSSRPRAEDRSPPAPASRSSRSFHQPRPRLRSPPRPRPRPRLRRPPRPPAPHRRPTRPPRRRRRPPPLPGRPHDRPRSRPRRRPNRSPTRPPPRAGLRPRPPRPPRPRRSRRARSLPRVRFPATTRSPWRAAAGTARPRPATRPDPGPLAAAPAIPSRSLPRRSAS